jgi:hypothetical protein
MKDKIKKGQNTWFDNFCSYWVTNDNNAPIAITCDQDYEGAAETADKFVAAYNATYGAGINPEAVSDLLESLKETLAQFKKIDKHYSKDHEIMARAEAAIEKAQIK